MSTRFWRTCECCGKLFPWDEVNEWEGYPYGKLMVCGRCAVELEMEQ